MLCPTDSGMSVHCSTCSPHHPTTQQTLGIRSMLAMARVAAPTVEAERKVSSSPVSEAVSEVRPPGGGFCVPGIAHGASPTSRSARRTSVTYRTAPRGATSTAATPLAYSTTSRSPCRQRRTPEASDSVQITLSMTSPSLPASRSSYVTSMLSPLISRTRSTIASTIRTLDALDANRDDSPHQWRTEELVEVTERLCISLSAVSGIETRSACRRRRRNVPLMR